MIPVPMLPSRVNINMVWRAITIELPEEDLISLFYSSFQTASHVNILITTENKRKIKKRSTLRLDFSFLQKMSVLL